MGLKNAIFGTIRVVSQKIGVENQGDGYVKLS